MFRWMLNRLLRPFGGSGGSPPTATHTADWLSVSRTATWAEASRTADWLNVSRTSTWVD